MRVLSSMGTIYVLKGVEYRGLKNSFKGYHTGSLGALLQ